MNYNREVPPSIYFALPTGTNYGWGLCGSYLRKELQGRIHLIDPVVSDPQNSEKRVSGVCFHALEGPSLKPWIPLKADRNIGYVFFENDLTQDSLMNSRELDLVLAGSSWCRDRLKDQGIQHSDLLIQGIDPELFYPLPIKENEEEFIIFSGGKFEYRKGQDLVLAAFKVLSEKYPHFRLINAWENQWEASTRTMCFSNKIEFIDVSKNWQEKMHALYVRNGIDPAKIKTCPLLPNHKMRSIYARTDLGLFPNRCEGGTNLVLMEYMACAKPVVASFSSGHQDILTDQNSYRVQSMSQIHVQDPSGSFSAHWDDPDLDELIAKVETAYLNRAQRLQKGAQAGSDLSQMTWQKMSDRLIPFLLP